MKKLFGFMLSYAPRLVFFAAVASILAGAMNTGMIVIVNGILEEGAQPRYLWAFLGICLLFPIVRTAAQLLLIHLAQKLIFDLRMNLSRQILATPLRRLEEAGSGKLLAVLTNDITTLSIALGAVPSLLMNLTIVLTCLSYMVWLYWPAALGVMVAIVLGLGLYQFLILRASRYFHKARQIQDHIFKHFGALTHGVKELKLHREKEDDFLNELLKTSAGSFQKNTIIANGYFAGAGSLGQLMFFIVIGLALVLLPQWDTGISSSILTGYTLTLIYLLIPLEGISNMVPLWSNAVIALEKTQSMGFDLEPARSNAEDFNPLKPSWKKLEYRGVKHSFYREKENRPFTLGPIDLSFVPGETVFIIGGNGSGKTTLAKLLLGLYEPEEGSVFLDDVEITAENRDMFMQNFSAIFADFYLFEQLLGQTPDSEDAQAYLEKLQLDHKVRVEDNTLSTVDLSQGQRKRLALLVAYLEDRPCYLFDEWAADQDPAFKQVFYAKLLPELKAKGKTTIVISHDDGYYHLADRIVKLDFGKIV